MVGLGRERLWHCPHCNNTFYSVDVSPLLTVKCPNCKKLQNINELFLGAKKLMLSGLAAYSRIIALISSPDEEDVGEIVFFTEFQMKLKELKAVFYELNEHEFGFDNAHAKYESRIAEELEQDLYFKKNVGSKIARGNVYTLLKNVSGDASKKSSKRSKTSRS